jgi:hypothetical protein
MKQSEPRKTREQGLRWAGENNVCIDISRDNLGRVGSLISDDDRVERWVISDKP